MHHQLEPPQEPGGLLEHVLQSGRGLAFEPRLIGTGIALHQADQSRDLGHRVPIRRFENPVRRAGQFGQALGGECRPYGRTMRLDRAIPADDLILELRHRLVAMALLAGALEAKPRVVDGAGDGDCVIGASVTDLMSHAGLLEIRHVTGDAAAAG